MSKNIVITEGNQGIAMGHVQKLRTAQSGGGEVIWVPEEEVETQSLYVSKNGTYYSNGTLVQTKTTTKTTKSGKKKRVKTTVTSYDEDNVCYGYDEVNVNITSVTTGKKNGKNYKVTTDASGNIVEEEIPSYIEITTPPDKTSYIVAEPISTAGMVVTAYYADGSVYGEIPREEYSIDPIVATRGSAGDDEYSDGSGINARRFSLKSVSGYDGYHYYIYEGERQYVALINRDGDTPPSEIFMTQFEQGSGYNVMYLSFVSSKQFSLAIAWDGASGGSIPYTCDGKFFSAAVLDLYGSLSNIIPKSTADPNNVSQSSLRPVGGIQTISVIWDYDEDVELTTSFEIEVRNPPTPVISGGDNDDNNGGSGNTNPITPHI